MPKIPRGTIYWVRGDDQRINTTYLLDVPVSGVSEGQVVRFNGSAYVPAKSDTFTNSQAAGVIVNINGATADLIVSNGLVTGYSGLVSGSTYYLSTTGTLTTTRPEHGLIVTVGKAVSTTALLVQLKVEEANPNIRRGQAQSGCTDGMIVRWNGSAYEPAVSSSMSAGVLGLIQNISGGVGDVYFGGIVPTIGMDNYDELIVGPQYFLGPIAGVIERSRPYTGSIISVGHALTPTAFYLNFVHTYEPNLSQLTPINWGNKRIALSMWQRVSGTGTLSYDSANVSAIGTGSFAITGTGVWELVISENNTLGQQSHYPISPLQGMGGYCQFRVSTGTGTIKIGTKFYDSNLALLTPAVNQDWWIFNGSTTSTTFTAAQAICRAEGTILNTVPTGTRYIRAKIEVVTNPGTIWLDNLTIYPLTFATMALYG